MPVHAGKRDFEAGLLLRFKWSVRRRGLLATVRLGLLKGPRWLQEFIFDFLHGLNTRSVVEVCEMSVQNRVSAFANRYQPTPPRVFRRLVADLSIPYEKYVFIDYGSGKGRTLLIAAEFPFQRVIGLEFAPELHRVAEQNIRQTRYQRRRCDSVGSICIDASDYSIPNEPAVLYFFYPFANAIMAAVLDNIRKSLAAYPRDIRIVNYEPMPGNPFEAASDFRILRRTADYIVYQNCVYAEIGLTDRVHEHGLS
jgi:SAM-dependent methyltransferase